MLLLLLFFPFYAYSLVLPSTNVSVASRTTCSGRQYSLYAMGTPVICDVDVGQILQERMEALEEGCTSEDELELEGDVRRQEDGWEDEEAVCAPGPSKVCVGPPAAGAVLIGCVRGQQRIHQSVAIDVAIPHLPRAPSPTSLFHRNPSSRNPSSL